MTLAFAPRISPATALRRAAGNLSLWIAALVRPPRAGLVGRALWPSPSRLAIGAALTIAAVAMAMLLLDSWAATQSRSFPRWFVILFDEITDFGKSGWVLFPTGILLLCIAALASPALGRTTYLVLTSLVVRLGFVFLAVAIPGLLVAIVKRLIGRARPLRVENAYVHFDPFGWDNNFASLPSGHSTAAFAIAAAVGALFPRARIALWTYAAVIALSRVVVGAHYPSDVIAGAVIGTFGALVVRAWFAARGLGFAVSPSGRIRAMPGPSMRRIRMVARRLARP